MKSSMVCWDTSAPSYLVCASQCLLGGWQSSEIHLECSEIIIRGGKAQQPGTWMHYIAYSTLDGCSKTHQVIRLELLDERVQVVDPLTRVPARRVGALR